MHRPKNEHAKWAPTSCKYGHKTSLTHFKGHLNGLYLVGAHLVEPTHEGVGKGITPTKHHVSGFQPLPSLKLTANTLKIGRDPNRKVVFQPSIFRGELLVSGRVYSFRVCVQKFDILIVAFTETVFQVGSPPKHIWDRSVSPLRGTTNKHNIKKKTHVQI